MNERTIYYYWLLTNIFLAAGLLISPYVLYLAMGVTIVHSVHFLILQPGIILFPMQIRIGYLVLLTLGQVAFLGWIHWIQLLGTTALLTTGYCPLARVLSLAPWNRIRPLSWNLFVTTIFTPPVSGSIVQFVSPESNMESD
ncbi:MAG: hypothetical protein KZQ90_14935 [Candidatus Thiodiazotropha sp. (ex Codakia rugifera)]|nr:hypothetical protein [Candidatus Thiodiazotropha sp. (ex Codakia rugifera)]